MRFFRYIDIHGWLLLRGLKACSEGWQTTVVKRRRKVNNMEQSAIIKDTCFVSIDNNLKLNPEKVYTVSKNSIRG